MTQHPSHTALSRQHILLFAKKATPFLAEHRHILVALRRQGCTFSLVTQPPSRPLPRQTLVNLFPIPFSDHGKNPLREALAFLRTLRLLYRLRPDIVIAYTLKPILYTSLANTLLRSPSRLVAVFTGLGRAFLQRSPFHNILTLLLRRLLRNAAQIWVLNEHNKSFLQQFLRHQDSSYNNKILVSNDMGIDSKRFRPPRQSPRRHHSPLRFLFLGRLLKAKGVSEYLQAARLLQRDASSKPPWEWWLAGSVEQNDPDHVPREDIEASVADGLVTWCGERDDIETLLSSTDCLVLPSYYAEGLPRVILEAAAMRVPAIVARYPGWERAVVENKTALVCACRDAGALAEAMRAFAALPLSRKRAMGAAARAFVLREFSQERAQRFYLSSLARLAAEGW